MTPLDKKYKWLVAIPRDLYESLGTVNQVRSFAKTSKYIYALATDLFPKDFCVVRTRTTKELVDKAVICDDGIVVSLFNEPEPIPASTFGMPIYDLNDVGLNGKIYVDFYATIIVFKIRMTRFYCVATIVNKWESQDDTL